MSLRQICFSMAVGACCFFALVSGTAGAQEAQTWPIGGQTEEVLKTSDGGQISYLLYRPDDVEGPMPLVLFLHGRGESYGPLSLVAKWGPPKQAAQGEKLPFLLVSPQCPEDDEWRSDIQQQRLVELLEHVLKTHRVDTDRVCLTGLSMGGFGSWALASRLPETFSCVVPICGGGEPDNASKLKDTPIWVFHGDQDRAVPFKESVAMVEAIRRAGGELVRFTTMEHYGHNSWSPAYATPELYRWMLTQKLGSKAK